MNKNIEIIISMTSWVKRIDNVAKTIYSLLRNTIKPTNIELNLSEEEFLNKELDLPNELLLLQKHKFVTINWVGKNSKSFKKLIPTVKKYFNKPETIIITVDDDVIYDRDFIEYNLKLSIKNPDACISFGQRKSSFRTQNCVNGAGTLYKIKFFTDILWKNLTNEIIKTNEDDWYYTYILWKLGKRKIVYTGKKLTFFNDNNGHNYNTTLTIKILNELVNS